MDDLIYVVDDEENILEIIEYNLSKNGYIVKTFKDGKSFLDRIKTQNPDLIILDLMLPDMDGFDICREIKEKTSIPVIILSARSEEFDKVLGLELGADDYMVKPFGIRELLARVKNILKRANGNNAALKEKLLNREYVFSNIKMEINEEKHELSLDGKKIILNPKEFRLIGLLLKNIDNLMPRMELIKKVWGKDYFGDTRTLDVHIRWIREKLSYKDFGQKHIITVHGYGYKIISDSLSTGKKNK
ncbi:MAG: response regulator transcription factor [Actinobacteria bacterium]|nr:response regulator transcription factor [Actinomycetota bacterium]